MRSCRSCSTKASGRPTLAKTGDFPSPGATKTLVYMFAGTCHPACTSTTTEPAITAETTPRAAIAGRSTRVAVSVATASLSSPSHLAAELSDCYAGSAALGRLSCEVRIARVGTSMRARAPRSSSPGARSRVPTPRRRRRAGLRRCLVACTKGGR